MTVTFDLTIQDVVAFNIYHLHHSPALRRQIFLTRIVVAVLVAVLSIAWVYLLDNDALQSPITYVLSLIGAMVMYMIYPRLATSSVKKRTVKLLQEGKNTAMLGQQQVILTNDALVCRSGAGDFSLRWPTVEKLAITEDHAFIYYGAISAIIVPKRASDQASTYTQFIQAVSEQITPQNT